jgi:hypothetical protein
MYFLDSDLRGPLADYTFSYPRQRASEDPPSSESLPREEQAKWLARLLCALTPRVFSKTRHHAALPGAQTFAQGETQ